MTIFPLCKTMNPLVFFSSKKSNKGCTCDGFQPNEVIVLVSQVEEPIGGKYIVSSMVELFSSELQPKSENSIIRESAVFFMFRLNGNVSN